jgi:hypothetical protein
MIPTVIAPHHATCYNALNPRNAVAPQPLPASGEGRQSVALAGWGSWGERK